MVLFTDGFASSDYTRLRELMDNFPHRLSVLAFGTSQGAPVRLSNGELLKDRQGAIVLPGFLWCSCSNWLSCAPVYLP